MTTEGALHPRWIPQAQAQVTRRPREGVTRERDDGPEDRGTCWDEGARWSLRLEARRRSTDVLGVMYLSIAEDFHLPSSLISSLEIPAAIAEFAAPRRKEWPEKVEGSLPV